MNEYQSYCKPSLAAALHSVGLDYSFHRAEKQYLYRYNDEGKEEAVLDLLGGYGAVILGHNDPDLIQVLQNQLYQQNVFHNQFSLRQGAANLAAYINPILQRETGWHEKFLCAFTSTGAESVEIALKHAEINRGHKLDTIEETCHQHLDKAQQLKNPQWDIADNVLNLHPRFLNLPKEERLSWIRKENHKKLLGPPVFIVLKQAFHGKLNLTIQLTYGEMYRHPLRRLGLNTKFIDPEKLNDTTIQEIIEHQQAYYIDITTRANKITLQLKTYPLIAALLVEPVQGEGGVYCLTDTQAQQLNKLARDHQIPLISDEVQSGCGRCGSFLAGSQIGLKPDYVVLSKGLGGGIAKIGLVAIREATYVHGFDLLQSSTFGEDDWSARVAHKFIEKLYANEGHLFRHIKKYGEKLGLSLSILQARYPDIITEVRGKGLLYGIEFSDFNNAQSILVKTTAYQGAIGYLVTGHLLVRNSIRVAPPASQGNVIRIEPTIQLNNDNINDLHESLEKICLALRYQDTGYLLSYLVDNDSYQQPKDYRSWYRDLGFQSTEGQADYQVAFINHLISSDWIKDVDPSLNYFTAQQTEDLLNRLSFDRRVAPFAPVRIQSLTGKTVDFTLYPINATSQQISNMLASNELDTLRSAIDDRLVAAREDGCTIAGLGMFTSIITNNGKAVKTAGIHLTTGNSLTVAMAAEAIQSAIKREKRCIHSAAVIGAAGNIGSVYSLLIAEYCPSLILVGSGRLGSIKRVMNTAYEVYKQSLLSLVNKQARGIAESLSPYARDNLWLEPSFYQNQQAGQRIYEWFEQHAPEHHPVKVTDNLDAISIADLLVCSANAAEAFISPENLKQNVLICDIAVPHNISDDLLQQRPDIHCLRGGIVKTPHGESLDSRARAYLKAGEVYACMAETIVLGLENYQQHYSYGNISTEQVKTIMAYSLKHGFTLSSNKTSHSM